MPRLGGRLSLHGLSALPPSLQGCKGPRHSTSPYMLAFAGSTRACTSARFAVAPLGSCGSMSVKFVMYKSGAAHPILGDEAREVPWQDTMECQPDRAVFALRHPRLSGANLDDVRQVYAPKLRVGGPAVVVDDREDMFAHVRLLDDLGEMMNVMLTRAHLSRGVEACRSVFEAPSQQVFGGWPARDAELTYPVSMLTEDVEFMWPDTVHQGVVVKRAGVPVDPDTGLGTLLRSPEDLQITVNSIDYPFELDVIASMASRAASKHAKRQLLFRVLLSEMHYLIKIWPLLTFWLMIEYRMYRTSHCGATERSGARQPHEAPTTNQTQEELEPMQVDVSNLSLDMFTPNLQGWGQAELDNEVSAGDEGIEHLKVRQEAQSWGDFAWWSADDASESCQENQEDAE